MTDKVIHDRGNDTSEELTEVRTVLSRAESAIATLVKYRDQQFRRGRRVYGEGHPPGGTYVEDRTPDVDVEDMIAALEKAIEGLNRWRRTGRSRRGER